MTSRVTKIRKTPHSLDAFILASKRFHTFWFTRLISYLMLATWVSLHCDIYKHFVKLATLKLATSSSENG